MEHGHNLHHFGPFCLDENDQVLLCAGRRVPLPAKAVSTLIVLVRNKGRVVEKDDLMKEVWPNEFVEEGNLAQHIFMLRRALGETAGNPKYIETVPRRGYRFLGTARENNNALVQETSYPSPRIASRFTDSPNAHRVYLKGRLYWSKHTREGLEQAITYFWQAIEFDPGYSLAYAAIVDCYLRLATNYIPPTDALPSTAVAAQVRSIEDTPPETLAALRLRCEWDLKSAEREVKRAVELKSNYPAAHQWNAAYLFSRKLYTGAFDMSKAEEKGAATQEGSVMSEARVADQFQSTSLTPAEEVQIFCLVAREQIAAGNLEAASLVLQSWYSFGQWPILEGLSPQSSADLLFTTGRLVGYMGSKRQVPSAQKHAEALLNGAIGISEQLGLKRQSAEGQMELGVCYWREGLFDLARNTFLAALNELKDDDDELRGRALLMLAMDEFSAGRLNDAQARLNEAAVIVKMAGPWLTAIHNHQLALVLRNLAVAADSHDYLERALKHYMKAVYQFEAIGNYQSVAITENNCGYLLITLKHLEKAEAHLTRAGKLYELTDKIVPGQFEDTRARFYIAAKQFDLAEEAIAKSIDTLEQSGDEAWLAESLTTQGVLLCRMGRDRQAKRVLQRACQIAEYSGNREGAERALLTLIEEMHDQLEDDERVELRAALGRLLAAQQASAVERRRKCLRLIA